MQDDCGAGSLMKRGCSTSDLTFFDDVSSAFASPTRSDGSGASASPVAENQQQYPKSLMPSVISQTIKLLSPNLQEKLKAFGNSAQLARHPMRVSTLCSGTDIAIDVLEACLGLCPLFL